MQSKTEVIRFLNQKIFHMNQHGDFGQPPCKEGVEAALKYLTEEAQPTREVVLAEDVKKAVDFVTQEFDNWSSYCRPSIKILLDYIRTSPLMPENPSDEIIQAMQNATDDNRVARGFSRQQLSLEEIKRKGYHTAAYDALRVALTLHRNQK